jgi:hypothetical protein
VASSAPARATSATFSPTRCHFDQRAAIVRLVADAARFAWNQPIEVPEERGSLFDEGWWSRPDRCPSGSNPEGNTPPAGYWLGCRSTTLPHPENVVGPLITWHLNGQVASLAMFHDSEQVGVRFEWNDDGCYHWISESDDAGELDGQLLTFHSDGALQIAAQYRQGRRHGLVREWDARGVLIAAQQWVDGALVKNHPVR